MNRRALGEEKVMRLRGGGENYALSNEEGRRGIGEVRHCTMYLTLSSVYILGEIRLDRCDM